MISGFSFGTIPLRVLPVSYTQYEQQKGEFNITLSLEDVAGGRTIPSVSSLPCESSDTPCCSLHCHRESLFQPDLDFDGTLRKVALNARGTTDPAIVVISVPVYNDGVREGDEGFAVIMAIAREELDSRDVRFVDLSDPVIVVQLQDGGMCMRIKSQHTH